MELEIESNAEIGSDPPHTPPRTHVKVKLKKVNQKHQRLNQKFRNEWFHKREFLPWLAKVKNDAFTAKCTLCDISMKSELGVLRRHMESRSHIQKKNLLEPSQAQRQINRFFPKEELSASDKDIKNLSIKICAFLVEHNISFRVLEHLTPLLKDCIKNIKSLQSLQLKPTKAVSIIKNVIGQTEKEDLASKLSKAKFSVLIDECTDIAAVKTMCIVVRYFDDGEGRVTTKFWEICQVFEGDILTEGATAERLFTILSKSFEEYNVPFQNIIGFASDGCNAMMGSKNSVASRIKQKCPGITLLKCVCHSLHLCASEACKELPRKCETLAQNIYNEFKNSSKRQHNLKTFQKLLDLDVHKILRPSQTRWLSLNAVVSRIVEQWDALELYFMNQLSIARLHSVDQILETLKDPYVKLLYLFLDWILPKFTTLNELFQSQSVILNYIHDRMCKTYRELLGCYLRPDYINRTSMQNIDPCNTGNRLRPEQMYFGIKVMDMLSMPTIHNNEALKRDFQQSCLNFLIKACVQIKQRFNFDDPILQTISILTPSKAVLQSTRISHPSLFSLMKLLPRVVDPKDYQIIDDEWRQLPFYKLDSEIDPQNIKVDEFWVKLMKSDNGEQALTFKNLSKFALDVLALPHSNADCERVFSQVNLIKTKSRNKMITSTVNGLLLAKQRINKNCAEYQPSAKEFERMTNKILYPVAPRKNTALDENENVHDDEDENQLLEISMPDF